MLRSAPLQATRMVIMDGFFHDYDDKAGLTVSAMDVAAIESAHHRGLPLYRRAWPAKRAVDVAAALLLLIVLALPMAVIAIAIRLESKGPAIIRSGRMGHRGDAFGMLKFRTMQVRADDVLAAHLADCARARAEFARFRKLRDDPRRTRLGQFLRRYSLDELPQLIHVLRGEMTLVGPRPYTPDEAATLTGVAKDILKVVPGLTGPWQVSGRSLLSFRDRVRFDLDYAKGFTPALDLSVLLKTPRAVLSADGAY
ncbi:MAG: sugar transferase [Alphaproteobacteria bacterium]|nr:sugar transferase [Alphaproteobacteria bacterium]